MPRLFASMPHLRAGVSRIAAVIAAIAATATVVSSSAPIIVALSVPGRSNSTPSITASGRVAAVVWSASLPSGSTDIYAAISRDGGRTFTAPVRVNDVPGDARVNGEQPPRVSMFAPSGRQMVITVVWTARGARGTMLLQSRSDDGGRSFARATLVPGTDAPGNRGWEAIAVESSGRVDAAWLDHREMAQSSAVAATDPQQTAVSAQHDGVAMAQKSTLYVSSLDASTPPHPVTAGVCYCCKTAVVSGADGALYAAWRHVYAGSLRDIAFTVSRDRGQTFADPIRVSQDHWSLDGCPDDGPAMVVGANHRVHVVWPTLVSERAAAEPTAALFYATSDDARHFTPRVRVPTEGLPHHAQIAIAGDGQPVVAWDETGNARRRVAFARVSSGAHGDVRFTREAVGTASDGVYPVLAAALDGVIAAWTRGVAEQAVIQVERLRSSRQDHSVRRSSH
jgi:hypothetical protein